MSVLMIFVDGFGLGESNVDNPYHLARTPFLDSILGGHCLYDQKEVLKTSRAVLFPTDARLGVAGIPQSATGQTTLWTGINAARTAGRHVQAFPTSSLRNILASRSIFKTMADTGRRATFANAYRDEYFEQIEKGKARLSTSTLAVMSGGQRLRGLEDLREGRAVYQDFTNDILIQWGYNVKRISPAEAGSNLARLAGGYDFTLYEYFITDRLGHARDVDKGVEVVEDLDEFLAAAVHGLNSRDSLVVLVSDHGNFEDMSVKSHTLNAVPTLLIGRVNSLEHYHIGSLTDVTPFVLQYLGITGEADLT